MINDLLKRLGLNEKEVAVFLAIYKIGPASVKQITQESNITRTHIYDLTEKLLEEGLIYEMEKSGIKHYEAVDHAGLISYISFKQQEWQKVEKEFEKAATIFKDLRQGNTQKTKVRFFEGVDGMKRVYEEIRNDLESCQESERKLITIWPTKTLEKVYPGFYSNGIYFDMSGLIKRDIMTESATTDRFIRAYKKGPTNHDYRIWPKEKGDFPTDALCWLNKVAYTDMQDYPSGIIIESKAVADTFRIYFEQMWESLGV